MKCPTCKSQFSELRDICPSCMLDLRPFKKLNNLPVSYPLASYDSLVRKLKREHDKNVAEPHFERKGFMLSRDPDDPGDAAEKALQELLQREFTRQQQKEAGHGEIVESSVVPLEVEEPPAQPDSPDVTSSVSEGSPAFASEIAEFPEVIEEPPAQPDSPDVTLSVSEGSPAFASDEQGTALPTASEVHFEVRKREESDELAGLFEEASRSFNGGGKERELSYYRIAGISDTERIELLFNLSNESLIHPEKNFSFLLDPTITMNSGMELVELKKAHEQVIFHTPSTPLPPLRSRQRQIISRASRPAPIRQAMLRKKIPLKRAPIGERLVAFLIDAACMSISGLAVGLVLCFMSTTSLDIFIVQLLSLQSLTLVQLLGKGMIGVGIMAVLYPLFSLLATGTTLGLYSLGLTMETEDAEQPATSAIFVRSCCFPLTLIAVGPLPIFPGERFLHDYLARVLVGRRD